MDAGPQRQGKVEFIAPKCAVASASPFALKLRAVSCELAGRRSTLLRLADRSFLWTVYLLGLALANTVLAQPTMLKAYRYGNTYYIAAGDVANYYGLGPEARGVVNRAEYKTSFAQLEIEVDRRDILVNGVNHW